MNNVSSNGRIALRAVQNDPPAEKLTRCKKIVVPLENNTPNETSDRILEDLRRILRTVQKTKDASSEEVAQAGDLLLRVKALGVRREEFRSAKNGTEGAEEVSIEELETTNRRSATPDPAKYERPVVPTPKREPDGYDSTFLEGGIDGAIERVIAKGYTPEMPIKQHEAFLQTALGSSKTLDALAVDQIYLAIAYNWKQRWNQKLAPMVKKLQTSVLSYANPRGFQIHEPDCLSFVESVDFGSM
jgi:hypothetical protein